MSREGRFQDLVGGEAFILEVKCTELRARSCQLKEKASFRLSPPGNPLLLRVDVLIFHFQLTFNMIQVLGIQYGG